jgi:hypothetical protein
MLASIKPAALKTFSTLDPLVTTSLNRSSGSELAKMARMIHQSSSYNNLTSSAGDTTTPTASTRRSGVDYTGELLKNAATLIEGALPVREFPSDLLSNPASIVPSATSSVGGGETPGGNNSKDLDVHEEELRCVLMICRHGDRSPKQVRCIVRDLDFCTSAWKIYFVSLLTFVFFFGRRDWLSFRFFS